MGNMKNKLLLLFLFISIKIIAQNDTGVIYDVINMANKSYLDSLKNINYLKPLDILISNEKRLIQIKKFKQIYPQQLNTCYSFLHLQDSIKKIIGINYKKNKNKKTLKITNKNIKKIVKNHRVVMLNEAHHNVNHRLFAETLLEPLYSEGFRLLAVEAYLKTDTINLRKYPISTSGFYLKEPYFANFIRKAIKIGYKIIPYESYNNSNEINSREKNQANNLVKQFRNATNSKLFVYAGYDHIIKNNGDSKYKWMAEYFKNITKIDPLIINQTKFRFDDKKNKSKIIKSESDKYDFFVIHSNKRKHLQKKLNRKKIKIKLNPSLFNKNNNKYIIQAYLLKEYNKYGNKSIPFNQQVLLTEKTSINLFLELKKDYFICIKNKNNLIINSIIIKNLQNKSIRLN